MWTLQARLHCERPTRVTLKLLLPQPLTSAVDVHIAIEHVCDESLSVMRASCVTAYQQLPVTIHKLSISYVYLRVRASILR